MKTHQLSILATLIGSLYIKDEEEKSEEKDESPEELPEESFCPIGKRSSALI